MGSEQYGYIHSCPTNLGTGMRASVMIDLPGYTKEGLDVLKKRCEELAVKPRLGYSEVQLIQVMIDGVNTLWKEDQELQKKHGLWEHRQTHITLWAFLCLDRVTQNIIGCLLRHHTMCVEISGRH